MADDPTPEVTAPVTAPAPEPEVINPNLDVNEMAILAAKIATNMRSLDEVLIERGLSRKQYDTFVLPHPFFKKTLEIAVQEWNSFSNTQQRLAVKTLYAIEEAWPEVFQRVRDPKETLPAVTEALKLFMRVSGLGEKASEGGGSDKITLIFDLGKGRKIVTQNEGTPDTALPETPTTIDITPESASPVSAVVKRQDSLPPLRKWGQGET